MSAIHSDAALLNEHPDALDSDEEILSAFGEIAPEEEEEDAAPSKSKKKPSEKAPKEKDQETNDDDAEDDEASEETPEDDDEDGEDGEGNEDEEGDDTEDDGSKKKFADDGDDTYVKITVDGQENEVKVSDLKRLWGQEASLTRKSQEVATQRQVVEQDQAKNIAAYDVLLKRSTDRANEFRALPWTQLMKDPNVDAQQLAAVQAEAQKAFEDEAFLKNEITGFMKKVGDDQVAARRVAATECLKALNDPKSPSHVKGWTQAVYNDIREFATTQGLNAEMVNTLTDPGAFKVLHMAMQFSRGKTKVITTKVNKTPTKIVKNSASAPAARSSSKVVTAKAAVQKARKSGSADDAINAFLALDGED